jgi:hypothetical protein
MFHIYIKGKSCTMSFRHSDVEACGKPEKREQGTNKDTLRNLCALFIAQNSKQLEDTRFRKCICFFFKWGEGDTYSVGPSKRVTEAVLFKGPNRVGLSFSFSLPLPLNMTTGPVSDIRVFQLFGIPGYGQSPETQWFWVLDTTIRTVLGLQQQFGLLGCNSI